MTGYELLDVLSELSDEVLSQKVMLQISYQNINDHWPRYALDVVVKNVPGEGCTFLGITGTTKMLS